MNKQESKYFATAVKMDEAFLALLHEKEFDYITVKEICQKAGVNRSTFYLHYQTVGDLLTETMEYINGKFASFFEDATLAVDDISTLPIRELYLITPQYLLPWLDFIRENKVLFQTFLKRHDTLKVGNAYQYLLSRVFVPIFTRYGVKAEDMEYVLLFYLEGITAMVKHWIREGCTRPTKEVAALIMSCIKRPEHDN